MAAPLDDDDDVDGPSPVRRHRDVICKQNHVTTQIGRYGEQLVLKRMGGRQLHAVTTMSIDDKVLVSLIIVLSH